MNENELKQAFIQWLMQQSGAKTEEEFIQFVEQLGEDGIKQAFQQFMQQMQGSETQQPATMARNGAKLDYIDRLNGHCPPGYTMGFYKKGGKVCKTCMKNQEVSTNKPKNAVDAFRCGRKMQKKNKKK